MLTRASKLGETPIREKWPLQSGRRTRALYWACFPPAGAAPASPPSSESRSETPRPEANPFALLRWRGTQPVL